MTRSSYNAKIDASHKQNRLNRRKPTETDASYVIFVGISQHGYTTEIILLLSGLLSHSRTVLHCLVCRITVEQFLILRAISHNFAQFPGISIHTPIIVRTVESWVFCVWIVWFILPRPQPGKAIGRIP